MHDPDEESNLKSENQNNGENDAQTEDIIELNADDKDIVKEVILDHDYDHDHSLTTEEETVTDLELSNTLSSFGEGARGTHVVELKLGLSKLGIGNYPANPSDFYGNSTTINVSEFQRYYGLEITGYVNEETLAVLESNVQSPYQNGKSGDHIVDLKKKLTLLGIGNYPTDPSGNFGSSTEINVRRFQVYYDLKENGIGDDVTIAKLNEVIILRDGVRGPHVVELKKNLRKLGIGSYPANPSDFFGDSTTINVSEFQRYYGLAVTGIVNEETLITIKENVNSLYQRGVQGTHIVELKQKLKQAGIGNYPANPSGSFGSSTEINVRRFQDYYGLKENGIADAVTLAKLDEIIHSPYQSGNNGAHVVKLKQNLSRLGIGNYPANPSPTFGNSTEINVRRFQAYNGLNENGIADEVTLAKIQEILNSPYRNGQRGNHVIDLKNKLSRLGIGNYPLNPSPSYGSSTETNVKRFQRIYGLYVSGIADEVTLNELEKAYQNRVIKIFIDPGHGGRDPGGQGYGLDEKDIVLDIALKTMTTLLSNYKNVDVILSRVDDTFITLEDRTNLANEWGADFYISLHTNAWIGQGQGFESFIHNTKATNEARRRQNDIHYYLINRIDVIDRGKKTANFHVLRESYMPALLLEYMFIDNNRENQKLRSASYRDYLGQITAEAIAHSFNLKRK
ncbi:MAG: hypothetical protein GX963_06095 [Bacteroidales bacterium]|nr:hypothetical protein [Bacteroidales bacterium]